MNWHDYGARFYQADLGRFFNPDRFTEKYYDMTPYQYGANNPILYIDVNGDSLILGGQQSDIQMFLDIANNSSGGFYKATINEETGLVSFESTGKEGKISEKQQAFIDAFSSVVNSDGGTATINVKNNSEDVQFGSFLLEAIDVGDISKVPDGEFISQASILGHEVVEQGARQIDGLDKREDFEIAHERGIKAEERIQGVERDAFRQKVDGGIRTQQVRYKKGSRVGVVTIKSKKLNVISVTEKVIK